MKINELANKGREFYELNSNKIKNKILSIDENKIKLFSKDELFDLGEIIAKVIFIKVSNEFRDNLNLNYVENIEFPETKHPFDVYSNRNMYELKIRRPSLNQSLIRMGGLLKKSKFEFMRDQLLNFNFYYINICFDRIFVWNLNSFSANLNFDYSVNKFKSLSAKNIVNNDKIKFLELDYKYCRELEFEVELMNELKPIFDFLENVETIKEGKKIRI